MSSHYWSARGDLLQLCVILYKLRKGYPWLLARHTTELFSMVFIEILFLVHS